jgi:hypothetical protein
MAIYQLPNPKPKCKLIGEDGNAFAVIGRVIKVLQRAGYKHLINQYKERAMAGDYNNLLVVSLEYVDDDESTEEVSDELY